MCDESIVILKSHLWVAAKRIANITMKKLIVLIILFVSQIESYCLAQINSQAQAVHEPYITDTLSQTKFKDYIDLVFSYKADTFFQVDTTLSYRINFVASHSFLFPQDLHDSLFLDSLHLCCIANPKKIQDSIIKLDFLDTDTSYISYTRLWKGKSAALKVFTIRKLNPNTGERYNYNGSASLYFDAEDSRIISFHSGQYLVISETHFLPDNRGSMPPGNVVTLFLELIK